MALTITYPRELLTANWFQVRFFTNFGYKEDIPSTSDWQFSASPMAAQQVSSDPDLTRFFKPISNQYSIGSCVANATADAFEAQIAQRNNINPEQVADISRLFIYWNARNLETPPDYEDNGTRIRLAFDCMARYGAAPETIWPYDISKVNVRPSILSYREAIKYRISAFYRISSTGDLRVLHMKQALCAGNPVVFGTKLANSFRYVKDETVLQKPTSGFIGAHAMVVVGWSEEKQAFKVRNSWGEEWGFGGYCWMHKDYLKADITRDIWVPTI